MVFNVKVRLFPAIEEKIISYNANVLSQSKNIKFLILILTSVCARKQKELSHLLSNIERKDLPNSVIELYRYVAKRLSSDMICEYSKLSSIPEEIRGPHPCIKEKLNN